MVCRMKEASIYSYTNNRGMSFVNTYVISALEDAL